MVQIDFETLGTTPDSIMINMAMVHFPDVSDEEAWAVILEKGGFIHLVNDCSAIVKFDVTSQRKTRTLSQSTIDFWKKQPVEARTQLQKSDKDLSLMDALEQIKMFFKANFDAKHDLLYSRGNAFDISIIDNYMTSMEYDSLEIFRFWNVRDVRTDIGSTLMNRKMDKCHLRKDMLEGFIQHNPIHDCCKDIMMMYYAQQYSLGNIEYPSKDESHPVTVDSRS
jgi:hypothetical protein